jgi:hypothetical protein
LVHATAGAVTHWLLIRGRGDRPLPRRVDPASIRAQGSTKRPSVQPGEHAILYASVWQAIYALVEITGAPDRDPDRKRWAWRYPIRPLIVIDDLEDAPPVEAAGIFPQSLWRHSHIRLTAEQFDRARELIADSGVTVP